MQNITIAGRLGSDAKLAQTQGGDSVCNFSVAVDYRNGREKATNWWRCALWGKRADALAPYLLKGVSVAVSGEFSTSEYEGKQQLGCRVGEVTLLGGRGDSGGQSTPAPTPAPAPKGGGYVDDLDDDIPF
jgi:single-strand DNA-binding protein